MRNLIYILLLLLLPVTLFSQYSISVEITGLRNNNGNLLYELFDKNQKSLKVGTVNIVNNKCFIEMENVKPGKYGFNYIHDENKNKKLDTKMVIIPKEGFGYSNNVEAKFGPPAYEKWIFDVKSNTKLNLKITYLNY